MPPRNLLAPCLASPPVTTSTCPDIAFGASSTLGYTSNNSNTGGVLAVSDGTHVASIALLGQYAASSFVMPVMATPVRLSQIHRH